MQELGAHSSFPFPTYHPLKAGTKFLYRSIPSPVGGLPAQDWSLRVTLVFRRDGSEWRQVHRHADALVHGISLEQLSALARG
jgi:hypothetical protein